jgi:hypothetical protein
MDAKVTRRQLAAALAVPALLAQTPDDELKSARDQIHQNGELLAKVDVPGDVEPAVHFKV